MKVEDIQDIIYEKEENGICTITFNRPERRNALSQVTFLEIQTVLDDMEKDKNTRVLIMTGSPEGRAFSSGGYFNMKMMTQIPEEILKEIDLMDIAQKKTCMKFWNFTKPVIAAINGLALGAGFTMPLVGADLIYMADDPETYIGLIFVKRAIIPEFSLSFLLPFYVGFQKAKEILYFGDKIYAKEAEKLGLINKSVPPGDLMALAREKAESLIPPKGPSAAIKLMKKTMHDYFRDILSSTLDKENEGIQASLKTRDFRESTKSLSEKRDPVFKGK
ncbi:MAG: enoyl-CoA hydratase/isomerase family protein [Candidatus Lokiarchaeota archaeon]|nr:enoyl-CoA hydratase/isomerase family protein [Candidatus Lokiarchaeota archaeon]